MELKRFEGEFKYRCVKNFFRSQVVESIVLTGGSTRLPLFRGMLKRAFPTAVLRETRNAEEVAAIGAAIIAQCIPPKSDDCGRLKLFK